MKLIQLGSQTGLKTFARLCMAAGLCAGLGAVIGCTGPVPDHNAEATAAAITGVGDAIVFQNKAQPINEIIADETKLTLIDAGRLALKNDPEIQAALARVRVAQAGAQQARLLPNPVFNIVVRAHVNGGPAILTPSIAEDLIGILEIPGKSNAADHRLRQSVSNAMTIVLGTLTDVQTKYVEIQTIEASVGILAERKTLMEKLLEVAKARLKSKEGIGLDVTAIEAQILNLETDSDQKNIDLHNARLAMARMIGSPLNKAMWAVEAWVLPPTVSSAQPLWIRAALQNRPEIQAQKWELAALGDDLKLTNFAPWEGATAGIEAERDGGWSLGPAGSTPVPIFDTGWAKKKKASAEVLGARHELTKSQRAVIEQVRRTYDEYAASIKVLARTRDSLIPLQEKRRTQAEAAYKIGETDLTTVLVAQEELQDARIKLVDLQSKTSIAYYNLVRSIGGPGIEKMIDVSKKP